MAAGGFSTAISYVPLPPQLSQGVPAGNVMAAWLHDAPLPAPRFLISVKHYAGGLSVDPPQVHACCMPVWALYFEQTLEAASQVRGLHNHPQMPARLWSG